ncbi:MAG: hypothetical protein RL708_1135 [Bacteroidota bacterium]|jgi:hypothetical protein
MYNWWSFFLCRILKWEVYIWGRKKPRDEPRAGLNRLRNNPCCDKLSVQK